MKLIFIVFIAIVLTACKQAELSDQTAETQPTIEKYLFLDNRIIELVENATLNVGTVTKHPQNPLFVEDREWEKRFDNLYGNVVYDEEDQIYKCWYSPFIEDQSALGMTLEDRQKPYDPPDNREMGICYATSIDGIQWTKPEMGLVEYNGSKDNNILWRGDGKAGEFWEGPHGSGIFKDLRESDPGRRYKAIVKGKILSVAFSGDGIKWGPAVPCPEADVAGDTHNNAFWAPTLEKYVGITREWGDDPDAGPGERRRWRQVARVESDDFVNWTRANVVLEGLDRNQQTYAMPVFYHEGVYLGLLAVHDQTSDRVWTELTWSPDTRDWHRISPGIPLIPNSDNELDYDYGCVYACAYPVFLENEIRLYYGGSDYLHFGWRNGSLCLATLRPDGFAGYEQINIEKSAKVVTGDMTFSGREVVLSADVETGGFIRVIALDHEDNPVAAASMVTSSTTDLPLNWDQKINAGRVKFSFEFDKAKLYAFGLQ